MKNLKKFEQFTLNNEQTNKVKGGTDVVTVSFANFTLIYPIYTADIQQETPTPEGPCFYYPAP